MRLEELDYNLPQELIAQEPIEPRDHARLMVFHRGAGKIEHRRFYEIGDYLEPGDVWSSTTRKSSGLVSEVFAQTRVERLKFCCCVPKRMTRMCGEFWLSRERERRQV
jgi:S-adenosylmethionine:tRNA-ribosyltransferase-isomerase (queuine synthetase)